MARKQQTDSITPAQLRRMLTRYASVLDGRMKMDGMNSTTHVGRARACVDVAFQALDTGALADVRHLVGLVQGVMLVAGIHTWEYLAADDRRE